MQHLFSTVNLVLVLSIIIELLLVLREQRTLAVFRARDRWR